MSMTNREELNAAEHETFPGPGPLRADEAKRGIHPVEQMVDAAIDRIAREASRERVSGILERTPLDPSQLHRSQAERSQLARSPVERSPAERSPAERSPADPGHALALAPADVPSTALATAGSLRRGKGRLRWKGLDVSEEFRSYADRVARGENLPPFQGKILAEPDPAFPWNPEQRLSPQTRGLKQQFGLWTGVALFLGLSVWVLVVQVGKQADAAPVLSESPLATVVLGNEPSVDTAQLDDAPQLGDAPALEPAVAPSAGRELAVGASATAAAGTKALASLPERAVPVLSAAPVSPSVPRAAATAVPSATFTAPAPVSSSNPVGVFVATRPAAGDLGGPGAPAGAVASVPPGTPSLAGAGNSSVLGGGVSAAGTPTAAAAGAASSVEPATGATHADPKKEPGREASTMGPLLVETPSF
jgi:hypothetical protein